MKSKGIVWIDRGVFPSWMGFCPSEASWKTLMKNLDVQGEAAIYPSSDARISTFARTGTNDIICLMTINDRLDKGHTLCGLAGLVAHECVHVWQKIREHMEEDNPSPEFEAYSVQYLVVEFFNAYLKTRKPKFNLR